MIKLKRYIPGLVLTKLKTLNYDGNIDHLYIICDMITRISIYRKSDDYSPYVFTDIPLTYFNNIISDKKTFYKAMNFLKENKIIECDGLYSKSGGKALGYRFNIIYISKTESVEINTFTLSRRIINNKNKRNSYVKADLKVARDHFMNTFKIDYKNALNSLNLWWERESGDILTNIPSIVVGISEDSLNIHHPEGVILDKNHLERFCKLINMYNTSFIKLAAINDGDLFFHQNTTNGRVDTNLTSLNKEYKRFIIQPTPLNQLDIRNSQPFMLALTLLDHPKNDEINRFIKHTSKGTFYDDFTKTYFKTTAKEIKEGEIKKLIFRIFYSENHHYRKEKNIFKKVYPHIYSLIEKEKIKNYKSFAIKLQRIESSMCIDTICPVLNKHNIKYYTIHDAWVVSEKDVSKTQEIIFNAFIERYNTHPQLKRIEQLGIKE